MKNLIFLIAFLFSCTLLGKDQIKLIDEQVQDIDNQILYKAYRKLDIEKGYILSATNDFSLVNNIDTLYYDSNGRIRKVILTSEDGELIGSTSYYDEKGYMIYSMNYEVYEGTSISQKEYLNSGIIFLLTGQIKEEPDPICVYRYENGKITTKTGCNYLEKLPSLKKVHHLDSLWVRNGETNHYIMPENCRKIKFMSPIAGDIVAISGYNVNIREAPNTNSNIIATLHQLHHSITILESCSNSETSSDVDRWYKIKFNNIYWQPAEKTGYIYGAFLEPVEREIK